MNNTNKNFEDFPHTIVTVDNEKITVVLTDDNEIRFYKEDEEISSTDYVSFEELESGEYLIVHMFPPYTKSGLGTAALELFRESQGAELVIQPFDGPEMENGSRVLPDARPFFEKMIKKGIIKDNSELDESEDNW